MKKAVSKRRLKKACYIKATMELGDGRSISVTVSKSTSQEEINRLLGVMARPLQTTNDICLGDDIEAIKEKLLENFKQMKTNIGPYHVKKKGHEHGTGR